MGKQRIRIQIESVIRANESKEMSNDVEDGVKEEESEWTVLHSELMGKPFYFNERTMLGSFKKPDDFDE